MSAKPFTFPKRRPAARLTGPKPPAVIKPTKDPDEPGYIQGVKAGSRQEWYVAEALKRLKIDFAYQRPLYGGRLPGGTVVDFWVETAPRPTPLYVMGDYWHRPSQNGFKDSLLFARIERDFYGHINPVLAIWEHELPDADAAYRVLKQKFIGA